MTIDTKKQLQAIAKKLGVREDWHEPDEQGIKGVKIKGRCFDNAGCEGEIIVSVFTETETVIEINLATLFALACE